MLRGAHQHLWARQAILVVASLQGSHAVHGLSGTQLWQWRSRTKLAAWSGGRLHQRGRGLAQQLLHTSGGKKCAPATSTDKHRRVPHRRP
jgi:hypothetical protein